MSGVRYLQSDPAKWRRERTEAIEGWQDDDESTEPDLKVKPWRFGRMMGDFTRSGPQTAAERHTEEIRWASLCGPVTVTRKGV